MFLCCGTSEANLLKIMAHLAKNTYNLNFTMQSNWTSRSFLDVNIFKQADGTLGTSLYRTPIAENTILHASSVLPQFLIKSIPYSQYLRIKRNHHTEKGIK